MERTEQKTATVESSSTGRRKKLLDMGWTKEEVDNLELEEKGGNIKEVSPERLLEFEAITKDYTEILDDTMPIKTTPTESAKLDEEQKNNTMKEIFIERGQMKNDLLSHFDLDGLKKELERKENVLNNLQGQDQELKPGLLGQILIIKDVINELGGNAQEHKAIVKRIITPELITTEPKIVVTKDNTIHHEKDLPEIDLLQHVSGNKKNGKWKIPFWGGKKTETPQTSTPKINLSGEIKEKTEGELVVERYLKTFEKPVTPTQKEKVPEKKFDTKKTAEEINAKIAEEEMAKGSPFTPEEKKQRGLGLFLEAKEKFNDKTIDSAGWLKNPLKKFDKWWSKDLEKTKWGKRGKVAMSAALIGSTTLLTGAGLGIIPANSIATRFLTRIAVATGFNMALTSHTAGKFLGVFKKETVDATEKKQRKVFNLQNSMMLASTGTAFIFSAVAIGTGAGLAAGGVALGSMVYRRWANTVFEKVIRERREKIEEIKGNFDIDALANNLEGFGVEYEKASRNLKKWEWGKALANGATTISTGLATMEVLSHNVMSEHEKLPEEDTNPDAMKVLNKAVAKIRELTEEKSPTPGETPTPEAIPEEIAIVGKGEGIENAFRRQIEANTELARSLGFKGDINDPKALHEFSGGAAHRVALGHGYVDKVTGAEIRVKTADEVAYRLKLENGELKVDEMKAGGDLVEGHGKGSEFEKDTEDYEYKSRTVHKPAPGDISVSKSSESFHLAGERPSEFGKFGNVDLVGKHLEPDYQEGAEVVAAREKVFAGMEEADQRHLEDALHKGTKAPETITAMRGTGLLQEYRNIIKNHPEFAKYSKDLTPVELVEFYETHKGNTNFIFRDDASDSWEKLKDLRAMKLLDQTGSDDSATRHLTEYIRLIRRYTGLSPRSNWFVFGRGKTAEEYIVDGLKILKEQGRLEQFEANLKK